VFAETEQCNRAAEADDSGDGDRGGAQADGEGGEQQDERREGDAERSAVGELLQWVEHAGRDATKDDDPERRGKSKVEQGKQGADHGRTLTELRLEAGFGFDVSFIVSRCSIGRRQARGRAR
jgi:hypothetical protein